MKSQPSPPSVRKDLVVLTADKDIEYSLKGIFTRSDSLQIQSDISYEIFRHPHKDSGCLNGAHDFLSSFANHYRLALVVFDREGSGSSESRNTVEALVETQLNKYGWQDRSAAIAIEPEVENWIWVDSPHLPKILNWNGTFAEMKERLCQQGFWQNDLPKPNRPKEAMDWVLRQGQKPHSSAIFEAIAQAVSLKRCEDSAFLKLKLTLQTWFPKH